MSQVPSSEPAWTPDVDQPPPPAMDPTADKPPPRIVNMDVETGDNRSGGDAGSSGCDGCFKEDGTYTRFKCCSGYWFCHWFLWGSLNMPCPTAENPTWLKTLLIVVCVLFYPFFLALGLIGMVIGLLIDFFVGLAWLVSGGYCGSHCDPYCETKPGKDKDCMFYWAIVPCVICVFLISAS